MTFRDTPSAVKIWNRALGRIMESNTISSTDDPGHHATVANRWYKTVVAKLLETHHWGLATKHEDLAEVVNTRSGTWLYAYAAPDDMAFPVSLGLGSTSNVSYYQGLGSVLAQVNGRPAFEFKNGVIYSAYSGTLEYVSFDITEADFNATFESLVILALAIPFALEIAKDKDLANELKDELTREMNFAMTNNLNVGHPKYGLQPSEAERARGSGGRNWDWFPMSPGEAFV